MHARTLVVAVLVVTSGCNALGAGDPGVDGTVTPVAVPDVAPAETPRPTAAGRECLAPPPETPTGGPPPTPEEAVPLGGGDGVVNGSALVDRHVRALSNDSYRLRIGNRTTVWSMPDAAAFTYEGLELGVGGPWVYAVAGTAYTLRPGDGGLVLDEEAYGPDSAARDRLVGVLTGEHWLGQRLSWHEYTVVDTRTWNGTEVRVLADAVEAPLLLQSDSRNAGVMYLNSTVYVDRRGIVRYVRHVRRIDYQDDELENQTVVDTLTVDQIGTARVHRPAAFCVSNPGDVRTPTPDEQPAGGRPAEEFGTATPGSD